MSAVRKPVAVPGPKPSAGPDFLWSPEALVDFPDGDESLEAEVVRLRRMVHALAEMLVECGIVDSAMVEGRLRLAAVNPEPLHPTMDSFSIETGKPLGEASGQRLAFGSPMKKPGLWSRLFGNKPETPSLLGAFPAVMMPVDQTVPVQKMSFEVQSLYDETGGPSVVAPGMVPQGMTTAARAAVGNCGRCWRRVPLSAGLCARCCVRPG